MISAQPYRQWLNEHTVYFDQLPNIPEEQPAYDHDLTLQRLQAFGYSFEDLRINIGPMAVNKIQPIGSMGTDTPLAVLSDKPQLLYNYFKQIFAQVTNPPIDPIREELVTSTETTLGSELNLLHPEPGSCRNLRLPNPIITNEELERLRQSHVHGFESKTLPMLFDPLGGEEALSSALDELFAAADLPVPFTLQVFNPYADDRFDRYKTHGSVSEMVKDIERQHAYPVLIKKYRSSVSQGVYVESDGAAVGRRLQTLFENSGFLDNTVLIQSFVKGPEYRVVASEEELLLVYEKRSEGSEGAGSEDPNPLHHASGQAVRVDDVELIRSLEELTAHVAAIIRLGFYAIDVIRGEEGFAILELNPNPFCYFYNRSNGREDFAAIYERLLEKYLL